MTTESSGHDVTCEHDGYCPARDADPLALSDAALDRATADVRSLDTSDVEPFGFLDTPEDPPGLLVVRNADGSLAAILDDDHDDAFSVTVAAAEAAVLRLRHLIDAWVAERDAGNAIVKRHREELARLESALRAMRKAVTVAEEPTDA